MIKLKKNNEKGVLSVEIGRKWIKCSDGQQIKIYKTKQNKTTISICFFFFLNSKKRQKNRDKKENYIQKQLKEQRIG